MVGSLQETKKHIQIKFHSLCYISVKVYYLSYPTPLEIATSTLYSHSTSQIPHAMRSTVI